MRNGITFEVCVDSVASALAAEQGGADRVELCSDLLEGGLTPGYGVLRVARGALGLKVMAMVRPRGGDFCYSGDAFEAMRHDVAMAKSLGADGVVFGLLNPDGTIDHGRTAVLTAEARPLSVTFHRAFDMTRDPFEALETLAEIGVDRILTSGQEASVIEGLDLIAALVSRAAGRLQIMPGGGVTSRNVARLVRETGVREIHFATFASAEGRMRFRNSRVFMGGTLRPPEYTQEITRPQDVAATIAALDRAAG